MMRLSRGFLAPVVLLVVSCARPHALPEGVSWNAESSTFTWWEGQVTLPAGFTYQVDTGADSFEGHFTSSDGKLTVWHDNGGYAGAWAKESKSFAFEEWVNEGARVWVGKRGWPNKKSGLSLLVAVTFPDSG